MSELPKCRLCGCAPKYFDYEGVRHYHCAKKFKENSCPNSRTSYTEQQWTALMGGGEPVAEVASINNQAVVFWDKSLPIGTMLYTHPQAAPVDDAVRLLDAAIALRDDLLLRAEMADDGCRVVFAGASVWDEFKKAIDAAMTKEQGNAKSDR